MGAAEGGAGATEGVTVMGGAGTIGQARPIRNARPDAV
jgi:hypothetical protein